MQGGLENGEALDLKELLANGVHREKGAACLSFRAPVPPAGGGARGDLQQVLRKRSDPRRPPDSGQAAGSHA